MFKIPSPQYCGFFGGMRWTIPSFADLVHVLHCDADCCQMRLLHFLSISQIQLLADWVYYYRKSQQTEWGLPALLVQAVHEVLGVVAQLRILLIVWDAAACEVQQPPHNCVLVVHIV